MHKELRVRNTKQRKHLLYLLKSTNAHPGANWLYENMLIKFPRLSLSTVYRNLGVLESQGLVQRLSHGGSFDRYDADTTMHSHLYCKKCGGVYDIETEKDILKCADKKGHYIEACSVTYYGLCSDCYKNK